MSTSLKPTQDILVYPPQIVPERPTLEHYAMLFQTGIQTPIINSVIVSVGAVLLSLGIGAIAAYAIARLPFRGKTVLIFFIVALMSIPLPSLIVPTFTFLANVHLSNSLTGLILLYSAYQIPFVVWILYSYFLSLPIELENAALIDGYSRFQTLRKVVLPLSGPGLVASGLFVVTFAWNDFVVAVAMISSGESKTLPVAIYGYLGFYGRDWGPLTAAAIISILPVIAVFVFFQRYFLTGMTSGGTKS
ncbi:MAG: carbohydrate ABC transporter permease [Rhizobiaceae bacterium]|nr:carbohydrate ABC transporter permease [Rhizobiaceae bacterium]